MLLAISSLSYAPVITNILKNGLTADSFDPEFLDDSCHCISYFALSKFNIYISNNNVNNFTSYRLSDYIYLILDYNMFRKNVELHRPAY